MAYMGMARGSPCVVPSMESCTLPSMKSSNFLVDIDENCGQ